MSYMLPSRRLGQTVTTLSLAYRVAPIPRTRVVGPVLALQIQHRSKFTLSKLNPFRRAKKATPDSDLPPTAASLDLVDNRKKMQELSRPRLGSSIFSDEVKESGADKASTLTAGTDSGATTTGGNVKEEHFAATRDPDPQNRQRWERKMVVRMIQRNGRESRADVITRTERRVRHKSPFMATSVKKLVKVAHQIAGKNVDDALLQMRFSKKKVAREVRFHLERARDKAVAIHGMGLGQQNGQGLLETPRTIKTKDGQWLDVKDPTRVYVAEAWVNKGPWRGFRIVSQGRGRRSRWMRPSAGISIVLKEEKTRIRLHDEKLAKQRRLGPWVHHPNRPVTAQRQYYAW